METSNLKIYADYQRLTVRSGVMRYASDTVNYVHAEFEFGKGWEDFDAVQAIWKSRYDTISVVLDEEGCCMVPQEVLARRSRVQVNLVGFTASEEGQLTARLTSYPALVLDVDAKAELSGAETAEITPSQFEQYVGMVSTSARSASESASAAYASAEQATESATSAAESEASAANSMVAASSSELAAAESALSASGSADLANASAVAADESAESASTDATRAETARAFLEGVSAEATTLAPGSQAAASYVDGVFNFGIPQGLQGTTGNGIASAVLNADYTLTLTFTDGTSYTTSSIRGEKGEKGDAGTVDTAMSGSSALPVQNKVIKAYVDNGLSTKADASSVPTAVSDLTNDAGYITGYTETDPTVPSWAKASSKPSYTASEVGAVPTTRTVNGKALSSNITLTASDVGAVATETDPVFTSSAAYGITTTDIDHWDSGLIEFDTSATSGDDYNLATALTAMGWLSDVIV